MAKLAVVFFAALAFQAVFAGVRRHHHEHHNQRDIEYKYEGQFKNPKQLTLEIQDTTNDLVGSLKGTYGNKYQIKLALREYVQDVETIIRKLQKEQVTLGNGEFENVIGQITERLRKVLIPIMQITDEDLIENVDVFKTQLVKEMEMVAEELEKLVQYNFAGTEQTFVQDILYDYLKTIQQTKMHIQGEYSGEDIYKKYELEQGVFEKESVKGKLYKYGKDGKGLTMQIVAVANDLAQTFERIPLDNAMFRQTFFNQFHGYVQELEVILEKFDQLKYDATFDIKTIKPVVENLREALVTFKRLFQEDTLTVPTYELKTQLRMYVQNFGNELEKLAIAGQYDVKQNSIVKDILVRYLIATRNLQTQFLNFAQFPQKTEFATTGYGFRMQAFTNGLISTLESVSVENKEVREYLNVLCREFAQQIEMIVERLQGETIYKNTYGVEIPQEVAKNLKELIVSLRHLATVEDYSNAEQLKIQLIAYIQGIATEIQKLLWVGQNYHQGQDIDSVLYEIIRDFVATVQYQQMQLQNVFQLRQYGQGAQQLTFQIQAITNNLAMFLQNAPTKGKYFEVQVRRMIQVLETMIERLEVEVTYTREFTGIQQVVDNLKQIILSLQRVTGMETLNYGFDMKLNLVLQNIAVELKKLAYFAQFEQTQGNLNYVVRSVLAQYLVVLQRVQIELQGINQTVQVGQTPRELALQIEIIANRLSGMLRMMVPDNRYTQESLVWQVRRFYQIIENIVDRLQVQITKDYGKVDLLQQVIYRLNQIKLSLRQLFVTPYAMNTQQLKIQLAMYIKDCSVEIQKLMMIAQSSLQGNTDMLIKGVLIDFLDGLQTLQMQIQNNLQIVVGGQSPRSLTTQIQVVADRLFEYLQWVRFQPNNLQFRQTLIIQTGEFTQTVENIVQMLRAEIKNGGENIVALQEIIAQFTKISLSLQKIAGAEAKITIDDLSSELVMHVQEVVVLMQRLGFIAQAKIEQTQVNYYGVLNGVFSNFLATLRNMLIQLQNTQEIGQYGQDVKELAHQIQVVTNKLTTSLQTVVTGTKQVKQTLALQILKYVRRIQNIVDRIETEIGYNSEMKVETLRQVLINLKQYIVGLQQVAESLVTKTTMEIKNQFNNYVQNVDAEIQKLLLLQTNFEQYRGVVDTVVKSVLIEYLAAVQNLQIQVQYISYATQKGLTLQQLAVYIRSMVSDLTTYLQRIEPSNKLFRNVMQTEVREFSQVLINIINKLQSESAFNVGNNKVFQQVATYLKEVHMYLQRMEEIETADEFHQQRIFVVNVQRAAAAIEQLVWTVQPQPESTGVYTGSVSLVREVLNDFLTTVQNMDVQILIALQNGQVGQYYFGVEDVQGLRTYRSVQFPFYGYSKMHSLEMPVYGQQYYGGKYFGGLESRQMMETPQQFVYKIQAVARQLSLILQDTTFNGKQVSQVLSVQVRRFAEIVKTIIDELQKEVTYKTTDVTFQQVFSKLREVQFSLQRLAVYNTFTTTYQLKAEFDRYVQIVVDQIEKLVLVAREEMQGESYLIVKNVFDIFYGGVQNIFYQLREVAQYPQESGYNYMNQYDKYDQGYGLRKYDQFYGNGQDQYYGTEKYGQGKYNLGYGLKKYSNYYDDDYEQMFGKYGQFFDKYYQGYGYGKDYGFNKYDQGFGFGKYGKGYKYDKYDPEYLYGKYSQYGNEYGPLNEKYGYGLKDKYGYGLNEKYGLKGKYEYGLDDKYGYGLKGKYEYGLNDKYGYGLKDKKYGYGLKGKYEYGLDDKYSYGLKDKYEYGLNDKYGYGLKDKKYGYGIEGKYEYGLDDKYGYGLKDKKYGYGLKGEYQYGLDDKYGYGLKDKKYGYGLKGKYEYGVNDKYGYGLNGKYEYGPQDKYSYGFQDKSEYGLQDKYGYGFNGKYEYGPNEKYGYGLNGKYEYGPQDKYSYGFQAKSGYGFQGETCEQLISQIRMIAGKIVTEFKTVGTTETQLRQVLFTEARQLLQIVDNMIDRLQVEITDENQFGIVRQVIVNLRQIRVQLERIVSSGVITTTYQIKSQLTTYIEEIVAELQKLVVVAKTDMKATYIVKEVLTQYLTYLRNIYYQYQNGSKLQFEKYGGDLYTTPFYSGKYYSGKVLPRTY